MPKITPSGGAAGTWMSGLNHRTANATDLAKGLAGSKPAVPATERHERLWGVYQTPITGFRVAQL